MGNSNPIMRQKDDHSLQFYQEHIKPVRDRVLLGVLTRLGLSAEFDSA